MKARTPEETANEQTIRKLYSLAEAAHKDTPGFVSMFGDGGDFYDVAAAKNTMDEISASRSTTTRARFQTCTESSSSSTPPTTSS
jgi:hypothetical protein